MTSIKSKTALVTQCIPRRRHHSCRGLNTIKKNQGDLKK